jgi:hypothetical protein
MYKDSKNPKAIELTKSHRERSINLNTLEVLKIDNIKYCAWCTENSLNGRIKYCSNQCKVSANAWAYPQKEEGLNLLLMRQDWKCNSCKYDYTDLIKQLLINGRVYNKPDDFKTELSFFLMKRIKRHSEPGREPEVDHVIPVSKGGQTLGISNHQVLCKSCHKSKSKIDNSGPRKSKT